MHRYGLRLAALCLVACGRSPPAATCPDRGRAIVYATDFETLDQELVLSGDWSPVVYMALDGQQALGLGLVAGTDTGSGRIELVTPVTLESTRLAVHFLWASAKIDVAGSLAVRLSTDGGLTFLDSASPVPDLLVGHDPQAVEVDFDLPSLPAVVTVRIDVAIQSNAYEAWVRLDDLRLIDLDHCGVAPVVVPPPLPEGMVYVPPTATFHGFFIDEYESTVDLDTGLGNPDQSAGLDDNDGSTVAIALSRAAILPRGDVSWYQARAACKNAGKRLCTGLEFERTCSGDLGWLYPYGDNWNSNWCNGGNDYGQELVTGFCTACKSQFGAYDLAGNLAEWIEDHDDLGMGLVRGGVWWMSTSCDEAEAVGQVEHYYWAGFRCCKDLEP